jgi:uncharacterized membrane protein
MSYSKKICSVIAALAPCLFGSVAIAVGLLSVAPAQAAEWKVCNATGKDANVAIVYSLGDARNYISKGWWKVPANGGCRVVFSGNLPIIGTYLRGEGVGGEIWEGSDLFCTVQSRFEIPNANLDEKGCMAKGARLKAYQMHIIKAQHFTTTLNSGGGVSHRID